MKTIKQSKNNSKDNKAFEKDVAESFEPTFSITNTDLKHTPDTKSETKNNTTDSCNVHTMPTKITDDDITSLFNGIILVVKKKIELEKRTEILNINTNCNILLQKLKDKQAECNRLKNEIIHLKHQLSTTC